jgi:hypothetical protein
VVNDGLRRIASVSALSEAYAEDYPRSAQHDQRQFRGSLAEHLRRQASGEYGGDGSQPDRQREGARDARAQVQPHSNARCSEPIWDGPAKSAVGEDGAARSPVLGGPPHCSCAADTARRALKRDNVPLPRIHSLRSRLSTVQSPMR